MEEILDVCDGYDPDRNEFTFHRQPRNFNSVLNFMRTGKLHLGEETCVIAFSQVCNVNFNTLVFSFNFVLYFLRKERLQLVRETYVIAFFPGKVVTNPYTIIRQSNI